jgi:superfamily I DNA/RNA helicase
MSQPDATHAEADAQSDPTPNDQQQQLIDSLDGTYLVDAGAGTGKTFTVTRRYANILETADVTPEDILLITFTRNAATEMRDRIVRQCDYGMAELADAPIQTFHSLCSDLLDEYGFDVPQHLGLDDHLPSSMRIIEDEVVEEALFQEFFERFVDDHPEYSGLIRTIDSPSNLLGLIKQLASKGVIPTAEGWYRDSDRHLTGDFEAFKQRFDEQNAPRNGGSKQSRLKEKLNGYGDDKCYLPDAPEKAELRGEGKAVPESVAARVFEEDREELTAFVHDLYVEYLRFALARNYLNFGFLQLFAFVLLCEDHQLRERVGFEYAMVDEFQDSSELQFKLTLLLAGTDNICVVGDWKQSIYSFQYAAVENITAFEERLQTFAADLNADHERVSYDTSSVSTIELVENYRSTQSILNFSEESLLVPAANHDAVDTEAVRERLTQLQSNTDVDNTRIEAVQHEDEHEALLATVHDIVGNEEYAVRDENDDLRPPEFGDIAVLTRTRDFGRELQAVADDHDLPLAYEGGIELFRTDEAKLLLAWLRILDSGSDRGWAVVLEEAGYTFDEIAHRLEYESYPEAMTAFRDRLDAAATHGGVARRVFERYGYSGPRADVLLHTIESVREATTLTRGGLIRFIAEGIETGSTHEVNTSAGENSVTVRTIHATKGLEHPIVIAANMNSGRFPPSGGSGGTITYDDLTGLRQRKCYGEAHGQPFIYDNWKADVLTKCIPRDYDEERRLLYVAITRAENHVLFTAGDDPNRFLDELSVGVRQGTTDVPQRIVDDESGSVLSVDAPTYAGPRQQSPHSLMDDSVYEEAEDGMGTAFGTAVHDFAERYILGDTVQPSNDDEFHAQSLIDSLSGDLRAEEDAYLPLDTDAGRVTLYGVIDLLHITPDAVDIIDYKTDRGRHAEAEYCKQLSVYYHVLTALYPDRTVQPSIFYTENGTRVPIDPLSLEELRSCLDER